MCRDGIKDSTFDAFQYETNGDLVMDTVMDADGNPVQVPSTNKVENEAAALICKAMRL